MRVAPMTSRFLDACRRRPTDVRPVWFMRQAGRYMKQYRQIREKHGILEICKRPDLAATVTLQPIEVLDVDAAIIFADLLLPIEPIAQPPELRPVLRDKHVEPTGIGTLEILVSGFEIAKVGFTSGRHGCDSPFKRAIPT